MSSLKKHVDQFNKSLATFGDALESVVKSMEAAAEVMTSEEDMVLLLSSTKDVLAGVAANSARIDSVRKSVDALRSDVVSVARAVGAQIAASQAEVASVTAEAVTRAGSGAAAAIAANSEYMADGTVALRSLVDEQEKTKSTLVGRIAATVSAVKALARDVQESNSAKKNDGVFDKVGGGDAAKSVKDGVKTVLLVAGAVLAVGVALKVASGVNPAGALAVAIAVPAIALSFAKASEYPSFTPESAKTVGMAMVVAAGSMVPVSLLLSMVKSFNPLPSIGAALAMAAVAVPLSMVSDTLKGAKLSDVANMGLVLPVAAAGLLGASFLLKEVPDVPLGRVLLASVAAVTVAAAWVAVDELLGEPKLGTTVMQAAALSIMSAGVLGSAFLLHNAPVLSTGQLSTVVGISVAAGFMAVAARAFSDKIGLRALLKLPLTVVAMVSMSYAISWSSQYLSKTQDVPIVAVMSVSVALAAAAFGVGKLLDSKAIRKASPLWINTTMPMVVAGMAAAVWAASHIFKKVAPLSLSDALNVLVASATVGASAYIMSFAINKLRRITWEDAVNTSAVMALIPFVIVEASHVLRGFVPLTVPPMDLITGSVSMAVAITAFGLSLAVMKKTGVGLEEAAMGVITVPLVAASVVAASHILALGTYEKYPSLDWSAGVGLAVVSFAASMALLSFVPLPLLAVGAAGVVLVAAAMVGFSQVIEGANAEIFAPGGVMYAMADTMGYFGSRMMVVFSQMVTGLLPLVQIFVDGFVSTVKAIGVVAVELARVLGDVVKSVVGGFKEAIGGIAQAVLSIVQVAAQASLSDMLALATGLFAITPALLSFGGLAGLAGFFSGPLGSMITAIERLIGVSRMQFETEGFVSKLGLLGDGLTAFADGAPSMFSLSSGGSGSTAAMVSNIERLVAVSKAVSSLDGEAFVTRMSQLGAGLSAFSGQVSDTGGGIMSVFSGSKGGFVAEMVPAIMSMALVATMPIDATGLGSRLSALGAALKAFSSQVTEEGGGIAGLFKGSKGGFVSDMARGIKTMAEVSSMKLDTANLTANLTNMATALMAFSTTIKSPESGIAGIFGLGEGDVKGDFVTDMADAIKIMADVSKSKIETKDLKANLVGMAGALMAFATAITAPESGIAGVFGLGEGDKKEDFVSDMAEAITKMVSAVKPLTDKSFNSAAVTQALSGLSAGLGMFGSVKHEQLGLVASAADDMATAVSKMAAAFRDLSKSVGDKEFAGRFRTVAQSLMLISVIDSDSLGDVSDALDDKKEKVADALAVVQAKMDSEVGSGASAAVAEVTEKPATPARESTPAKKQREAPQVQQQQQSYDELVKEMRSLRDMIADHLGAVRKKVVDSPQGSQSSLSSQRTR